MNTSKDNATTSDFPAPREGFVLTHTLIVKDRAASCQWYKTMPDPQVAMDMGDKGGPCIVKAANSWLKERFLQILTLFDE